MNIEQAVELLRGLIGIVLMVISPILLVAVAAGLVISILQSATSIQEQTLSFVPKLFALAIVTVALGPWLLRSLTEFAIQTITKMGEMGR